MGLLFVLDRRRVADGVATVVPTEGAVAGLLLRLEQRDPPHVGGRRVGLRWYGVAALIGFTRSVRSSSASGYAEMPLAV